MQGLAVSRRAGVEEDPETRLPCPEGLRHGGGQWVTPSACLHRGGPGTCPWVMATPSTSRPMGTRGLL